MKNLLQIEKRLTDLELNGSTNDIINQGRIDVLYWIKVNNVDSDEQIKNKITRIKEEMLSLQSNDEMYKEKQARIEELENVL